MLFCAGRMFEMPVTDPLHPPPSSLYSFSPPTHTVFYNVPLSSSGRVQCSIAELCRAYFFVFVSVCVPAHIVTVWRNETTREPFSEGDFMERLIYSMAIHTILLVLSNPSPLYFSMSIFLFMSSQSLSCPFSTALSPSPHSPL